MKTGIHPEYKDAVITCGCGEKIVTRSTKGNVTVAVCSKCHPFFTGKQKYVDDAGRIEKFQRRYGWAGGEAAKLAEGKKEPAEKADKPATAQMPTEAPAQEPSED